MKFGPISANLRWLGESVEAGRYKCQNWNDEELENTGNTGAGLADNKTRLSTNGFKSDKYKAF